MAVVETLRGDPEAVQERWNALVGVVGEQTAEMLWLDETGPSLPVYEFKLENGDTVFLTDVKLGKVASSEVGPAAPSIPLDLGIAVGQVWRT